MVKEDIIENLPSYEMSPEIIYEQNLLRINDRMSEAKIIGASDSPSPLPKLPRLQNFFLMGNVIF